MALVFRFKNNFGMFYPDFPESKGGSLDASNPADSPRTPSSQTTPCCSELLPPAPPRSRCATNLPMLTETGDPNKNPYLQEDVCRVCGQDSSSSFT